VSTWLRRGAGEGGGCYGVGVCVWGDPDRADAGAGAARGVQVHNMACTTAPGGALGPGPPTPRAAALRPQNGPDPSPHLPPNAPTLGRRRAGPGGPPPPRPCPACPATGVAPTGVDGTPVGPSRPAVVALRFLLGGAGAGAAWAGVPAGAPESFSGRRRCSGRSPFSTQASKTFRWLRAPTTSRFHTRLHVVHRFSLLEWCTSRWSHSGQNWLVLYSSTYTTRRRASKCFRRAWWVG
jgi:hypothetical protein